MGYGCVVSRVPELCVNLAGFRFKVFGYSLEVHEPEDSWTAIAAQLLFRVMYAVAREAQLYLVTVLL